MAEAMASRSRVRARIQEVADRITTRAARAAGESTTDSDRLEPVEETLLSIVRED